MSSSDKPVLIIPSAKYNSAELQSVGKIPPIIYPIGGTIVYDVLSKKYSGLVSKTRIVCFDGENLVRSRINPVGDVEIVSLDGPLDLGHSVHDAIGNEAEIVINFGDTIIDEDLTGFVEDFTDAIYFSEDYISEKWTFFDVSNGKIYDIIDKEAYRGNCWKKFFVGLFRIGHAQEFKSSLEHSFEVCQDMDSFYHALRDYSQNHPLNCVRSRKWLDVGHLDDYTTAKTEVQSRVFNYIHIDRDRGILRKDSDNRDKFSGEVNWYVKLPSDLEYCHPRIFSYSTDYRNPYVEMEYYSYHSLSELYTHGNLSENQWRRILQKVLFIFRDFQRYKVKGDDRVHQALNEMYLQKTVDRIEDLRGDDRFASLFEGPVWINGIKYPSLDETIGIIQREAPRRLFGIDELSIIHGDFCFANILVDDSHSFIKLIDPRGKFGEFDIYGDSRYDLAKLFHSVDGKYDFIIKDQFTLDFDLSANRIDFEINGADFDFCFFDMMKDVFGSEIKDESEVVLIESLLFLSMVPLHRENYNHQLVMLATGLQLFSRIAGGRKS